MEQTTAETKGFAVVFGDVKAVADMKLHGKSFGAHARGEHHKEGILEKRVGLISTGLVTSMPKAKQWVTMGLVRQGPGSEQHR